MLIFDLSAKVTYMGLPSIYLNIFFLSYMYDKVKGTQKSYKHQCDETIKKDYGV